MSWEKRRERQVDKKYEGGDCEGERRGRKVYINTKQGNYIEKLEQWAFILVF